MPRCACSRADPTLRPSPEITTIGARLSGPPLLLDLSPGGRPSGRGGCSGDRWRPTQGRWRPTQGRWRPTQGLHRTLGVGRMRSEVARPPRDSRNTGVLSIRTLTFQGDSDTRVHHRSICVIDICHRHHLHWIGCYMSLIIFNKNRYSN